MKVLITGVSGFIGHSIAQALQEKGCPIVGFSRNPKKTLKKLPFLKECYSDFSPKTFQNVSTIINLAGTPVINKRWTKKQKQILMDSRIQFTKKLVSAANQYDSIQTLISTSAIGYYGHRTNEELDEHSPPGRGFIPRLCIEWEKIAGQFKRRTCIFRISNVLSPKGGLLKKLLPAFKCGLGTVLGDGRQWMSWIHLQDLIKLYITALEHNHWEGVFNACSLEPITNQVFAKKLAKNLGRPCFIRMPQRALELILGERSSLILSSQKILPVQTQKKGLFLNTRNWIKFFLNSKVLMTQKL